jgi:hypothetical protein
MVPRSSSASTTNAIIEHYADRRPTLLGICLGLGDGRYATSVRALSEMGCQPNSKFLLGQLTRHII